MTKENRTMGEVDTSLGGAGGPSHFEDGTDGTPVATSSDDDTDEGDGDDDDTSGE